MFDDHTIYLQHDDEHRYTVKSHEELKVRSQQVKKTLEMSLFLKASSFLLFVPKVFAQYCTCTVKLPNPGLLDMPYLYLRKRGKIL